MSKRERPLILITNDDGVDASGIRTLAEVMRDVGQVVVVAPDRERSAIGHGISLTRPLRITGREPDRFAISGSPVDAVLLGLFKLCPRRPDLVVSGINLGLNLGTDVLYSGTLAAALEGAIHDVPALAVSQELPRGEGAPPLAELLERTARFAAQMVLGLRQDPLPPRTVLSINAPAAQTDELRWTRLGRRIYRERIEERLDLRGVPYYWIGGPVLRNTDGPGTDAHAVEAGAISLTLLGLDLTVELPDWYHRWRVEGYHRVEGDG